MGNDDDYSEARKHIRGKLQYFVDADDDMGTRDGHAFIAHWEDEGLDLARLREILNEEKTSVGYRGELGQYG